MIQNYAVVAIVATLLKCCAAQKEVPPPKCSRLYKILKVTCFLKLQYYFTRHGKC